MCDVGAFSYTHRIGAESYESDNTNLKTIRQMKKQLTLILLAFFLSLAANADVWQDPETKVNYGYTPEGNVASVLNGEQNIAGSPDATGNITILSSFTVEGKEYTVTSIGNYAFYNCNNITAVVIPSSVTMIGRYAFYKCTRMLSVDIPNSVTSIGNNAFWDCQSLSSIILPNSLTTISQLFPGCYKLESVVIPNSVTTITNHSFYYCTSLKSVTIPASVTSIGSNAFEYCDRLNTVKIERETPITISESVFSNRKNAKLYVPIGCISAYQAALYWKDFKEIVEDDHGWKDANNSFLSLKQAIKALYDVTSYHENVVGAHETLRQAIINAEAEATNASTAEELTAISKALKNAGVKYVNDASPMGTAYFDITFMLMNPELQEIPDWTKADGWYTDQMDGNSQAMTNDNATSADSIHSKFYEYWSETAKDNNMFTIYQKVNLPVGKYNFSCYAFASGSLAEEGVYLCANDYRGPSIYNPRLSETSIIFRQSNYTITEVRIGTKVFSGNSYNWMGIGYAHLYKVYDIESDQSATRANEITLTVPRNTMEVGDNMNATVTISPSNATLQEMKWSSSDPFVCCVNKNGKITAYNSGTAKIVATTLDGSNISKEVTITVTEKKQEDTRIWTDLTTQIINSSFDTQGNNEGWIIERNGGTSEIRSGCLEFWDNNHFKASQLIEDLPKGHYRLKVQGYHRYGGNKKDYERQQEGEPTSLAYLFANEQRQTLVPYCSYFESTKPNDNWVTPDNGKHWRPHTMESASEAFAKDAYWNILEFDIENDKDNVNIGIALDKYTYQNWCIFTNFKLETDVEIDFGKTYTLAVYDESGNNVSDKVSIIWYNGQDNQIGTGSSIGGVKKDTELYYSVLLNQSLGIQYHEIIKQKVTKESENVVCQLKKIERVTLTGQVLAYGTVLPRVKVNLTQWLNGKYEYETSTLTDADGKFSLDAYNDTTVLIVTANGYIDNKITRRNLNNGSNLGEIDMTEVQGKVVKLDMSYQEATREGVDPIVQSWYRDTRNIDYSVRNITKGKELDDFAIQSGNIVLPTGTDRGDKIQVTIRSLNDKFAEVTAEGIIADNDTAAVTIQLLAFGGIEATYGQKADDQLLAMLYDNAGKLQMRTVCTTSRLTFSNLASGSYTLVTMGYNGAIGSVSDISDLANLDLVEGLDYVRSTATVHDGVIATVNVASVPELDASKFEYTGMNTYFTPNKTQLMVGNYITLSTRLDFKEQYADKIDHATIVIDIPEGCEFVANSVVIGTKPLPHSLDGNKLKITVDKDDIDNRIRFCVIPKQSGKHITSALAEFDYKGMKAQPMGQIQFEGTVGEVYVPSTTKTKTITVAGIGVPKADVEVYDNDALIGTTKSLGNGKWSLKCELNNAYNLSTHDIFVKYRGEGDVVGLTEAKECFYDINAIVPKTVTMVNTAHPAGNLTPKVYKTVFNYETILAVQNYYLYWPNYPEFTFLIDLSENDTTKVSDVNLYVYTTDGDKRKLPAEYDGKLNCFVATSSFDMYSLPVNVFLDYASISTPFVDTRVINEDLDVFRQIERDLKTSIQNEDVSIEGTEYAEIDESEFVSYDKLLEWDEIDDENHESEINVDSVKQNCLALADLLSLHDSIDIVFPDGIRIIKMNYNEIDEVGLEEQGFTKYFTVDNKSIYTYTDDSVSIVIDYSDNLYYCCPIKIGID